MNWLFTARSLVILMCLAVAQPARSAPAGHTSPRAQIVLSEPGARDGVREQLLVSGTAPAGARVSISLVGANGRLLSRRTVRVSRRTFRASLPVPRHPGGETGRVRVSGAGDTREVPVVFQRPLLARTERLFRSLSAGDMRELRRWAGPRLFQLVVEGSRGPTLNLSVNRERMRSLLRWARRRRGAAVRRVSIITNRQRDGYTAITLRLDRGVFEVGVTFDGRLHKIFATRRGVRWD